MFDLDKFIDNSFEAGQDDEDCDIVIEAWCERVKYWYDIDRLFYKKSFIIYFTYKEFWASWVCFSKRDLKAKIEKLLKKDTAGDLKIRWIEVYALGTRTREEGVTIVFNILKP